MNEFNWQEIANAVYVLVGFLLLPAIALAVRGLVNWAKNEKSKLALNIQALVDVAVDVAVFAAEAAWGAGNGDEKLADAVDWATEYLRKRGIEVDIDELVSKIEAVVFAELNKWKEPLLQSPGAGKKAK